MFRFLRRTLKHALTNIRCRVAQAWIRSNGCATIVLSRSFPKSPSFRSISFRSQPFVKFDSRKWLRSINGTTVPDNCFTTRSRRMTTRSENRRSRYSWSDVRCSLRKQSGAAGRGGERGECGSVEGRGEKSGRRGKEYGASYRRKLARLRTRSRVAFARDQFPFPSPPIPRWRDEIPRRFLDPVAGGNSMRVIINCVMRPFEERRKRSVESAVRNLSWFFFFVILI